MSLPIGQPWNQVLRSLREARGLSQEAWANLLHVGRRTVQHWESAALVPDARAEAAIIEFGREQGLIATSTHLSLWGVIVAEQTLRTLLAQARLKAAGLPPLPGAELTHLWAMAQLTHRLRVVPAGLDERALTAMRARVTIGSPVQVRIELDRPQHLLLIEEDTEGILTCLCPSRYAPTTCFDTGAWYLPQPGGRSRTLTVNGPPGTERLLAILSDRPLPLDWLPTDPMVEARVLDAADLQSLAGLLGSLTPGSWRAWTAEFDVVSPPPTSS